MEATSHGFRSRADRKSYGSAPQQTLPRQSPAQPPWHRSHLVAHDGNPDAVGSRMMLFFRRYPRFTLLLSVLLIASLLLLTYSPFPSLQPSSAPPTPTQPLNSSNPPHDGGLASRVRRAERAYQKMLLGRDALISKMGPTPHNVALCVLPYPPLFFSLIGFLTTSDFHQIGSRGHRIQFVSPSSNAQPRAPTG